MKNEDILKLVIDKPDSYVQIIKAHNKDFYSEINRNFSGVKFGEKLYKYINGENVGKCKQCGKATNFKSFVVGYTEYCSKKCSNISTAGVRAETIKSDNLKKRHVYYETKSCLICGNSFESLKYRKQKCCSSKCSGIYVATNPNRIEKIKKTKLKKYGNATYVNPDKAKKTCMERYGVSNIAKTDHFKNLAKNEAKIRFFKSLENHKMNNDVIPLFTIDEYISTNRINRYKFQCKKCESVFDDNIDDGHLPRCLTCNPFPSGYSKGEKELAEQVQSFVGNNPIIENDRTILDGLELDIYIPHKNIAIEYDGLYWHGEKNGGKNKNYHLNKTEICRKKGIQLIHIFEDEWTQKKEIVKNKLKHILCENDSNRIYARNCEIKELDTVSDFLNEHHIQGDCPSSIKLGAYHAGKLIAVMTFINPRIALGKKRSIKGEYELLRFATSSRAIGIASKLLTHFKRTYNPTKIVTYADKRYSNGNLYEKMGFIKKMDSPPNYWYYIDGGNKRWHRFNFRKGQLSKKLNNFDENLSEWENMKNNGYDRIWDCGNMVYEWNKL